MNWHDLLYFTLISAGMLASAWFLLRQYVLDNSLEARIRKLKRLSNGRKAK